MESQVFFGSEIKLNVGIEPIGDLTMDDYDFECEFYCFSNKKVNLHKRAMIRRDERNYIAPIDSSALGAGSLKCKVTAYIPDMDFEDGVRTEIVYLDTQINIVKI